MPVISAGPFTIQKCAYTTKSTEHSISIKKRKLKSSSDVIISICKKLLIIDSNVLKDLSLKPWRSTVCWCRVNIDLRRPIVCHICPTIPWFRAELYLVLMKLQTYLSHEYSVPSNPATLTIQMHIFLDLWAPLCLLLHHQCYHKFCMNCTFLS